jgi:hypothetical protein
MTTYLSTQLSICPSVHPPTQPPVYQLVSMYSAKGWEHR